MENQYYLHTKIINHELFNLINKKNYCLLILLFFIIHFSNFNEVVNRNEFIIK